MFGLNLLRTTFEKISKQEIFKPLMQTVVVPRMYQRFFILTALHVPTIVEAAKATCRLKSWADRQNFPLSWIGSGQCIMRFFHGGTFYPYQLQVLLNVRMGHDTECRPLTIGKLCRPFRK